MTIHDAPDGAADAGGRPSAIRVLAVDDHPLARSGLRQFLKGFDGLELVGEASSGEAALDLCARLAPDVVLMDLVMPGIGGVEATRQIRGRHPATRVVVLTSFEEGPLVQQALAAGATGYLLKTASAFELARAVRAAHAGRAVLAPEATDALARSLYRPAAPGDALTAREQEVLRLLAQGLSNAEIAGRLTVSPATVKFHVANVLDKLGVATRAAAIAQALRRGLL